MNANLYDVIIIGGGPAGLTAALYLARAQYRVLVIEKEQFGGQITITDDVVNYPGVERGSGEEITAVMRRQAQSFGAEFLLADAHRIEADGDYKHIHTSRGEYIAYGLIIATGAYPRSVGFEGEQQFKGRGVAYCATCDGEFFTDMDIFVVGGGFAAAEEAVFLTRYARQVTVLVRGEDFTCAKATADLVKQHEKIQIRYNTTVETVTGDSKLRAIRYKNTQTGEVTEYQAVGGETFGVFVFAGYVPNTELVKDLVKLDEYGYIITDANQKTSQEGIYGAGDVCVKNLRQMVTATADGAIAATELERYAADMHTKTGQIPKRPVTQAPKESTGEAKSSTGDGFFTDEIRAQLAGVFEKMANPIVLKLYLDERPVSEELQTFIKELISLTDKITVQVQTDSSDRDAPCVAMCAADGTELGMAFHGVPGGHEFNSFILGLYNAAGPGQVLDEALMERIRVIDKPVSLKILVSLSCTKCPELVMAAQRIAAENPNVRAEAYDLNHFSALKDQYNVMSVPCLVVNDEHVTFGKMNVQQLLEYLEELVK
ncbi:FAD-dependent oxidoreductase [Oscillospiraceae bacterium MB08-C2-2]|nr:FAD-dependent oxidoreductase [Oscillospiraceae bacterium MB08-C2-2]